MPDALNRLAGEHSPYLLQHAHNPVDWYPWGPEAFAKAAREDKPVFLSIGYSTCHWCHVMAHQSFEDPAIAQLLHDSFVSVKVDREERPDVDATYMTVCQLLTGSGGWPLSIFLTPDKQPFYAATYIPKDSAYGRPGLRDLLPKIADLWRRDRAQILDSAAQITAALQGAASSHPSGALDEDTLDAAYAELEHRFDTRHGGFGGPPKFPTPHNLTFLLRYWKRTGLDHALAMVQTTLLAMRQGGIFDHLGFGFHRYSTDRLWLLPHFEKMLYDQALLAIAYLEAYQVTANDDYAAAAREIFAYVLRDLADPAGGFHSAEDADSEGVEGKFYLWTPQQIRAILGPVEGDLVVRAFGVQPGGNFADQATGEKTGESILHLPKPLPDIAADLGLAESDLRARLAAARQQLFQARASRVRPGKDDKVLADWNGLLLAALAKGAQVLGDEAYATAARRAADFLLHTLRSPGGRLLHRYRRGQADIPAFLDDYAFLVWGLLELYEATFAVPYLQSALDLDEAMLAHFWDTQDGGLFLTADDAEQVLVRHKEVYDGALPAGNSVAALNLLRLARITGRTDLEDRAQAIFRTFAAAVERSPSTSTQLLCALDFAIGPSFELAVVGRPGAADSEALLGAVRRPFVPNKVLVFRPDGEASPPIDRLAAFARDQVSLHGQATAYVCSSFACLPPTADAARLRAMLGVK